MYHNDKPKTLQHLRQKIINVCDHITQDELEAGVSNIIHRLQAVVECGGDLFEHKL